MYKNSKWVRLGGKAMPPFKEWLPSDSEKQIRINFQKYFELKYADYNLSKEDFEIMINDIFDYIDNK